MLRVVVSVAICAVTALPASAKGLQQELTIVSGPGLEEPLILNLKQWGIPQTGASPQAVVTERLLGLDPKPRKAPAAWLGPAYELHHVLSVYDPAVEARS